MNPTVFRNDVTALLILLATLMVSCGKPGAEQVRETYNYTIDKVLVDSKGEFLFLEHDLDVSDYSEDEGYLYNYNKRDHSIEKIDLDRLEWVANYPLSKEGPDGTGFYISALNSVGGGKLFLAGEKSGLYGQDGKLLERFDWSGVLPGNGRMGDEEDFYKQVASSPYEGLVFSTTVDYAAITVSLKKFDLAQNKISTFNIDTQGNYRTYTLGDLTTFNRWGPKVYIGSQKNKILVSHEFSNEFYVYCSEIDSLKTINYASAYTPGRVEATSLGDPVNSIDDRIKTLQSYLGQVSFGEVVWDAKNKRYYRLSSSTQYGGAKREGRILPEISESKVYFSLFDESFNFLGEEPIPELNGQPLSKYFVKDGSLWVYFNQDDELGFFRIKFG